MKGMLTVLLVEAILKFKHYQLSADKSASTIQSYANDLLHFFNFITKKYNCEPYLSDITAEDIEDYMYVLKHDLNYTSASRKRKLAVFRTFFNFCFRKKLTETNPVVYVEPVRLEHKERLYLSEDEVHTIVDHIEHPLIKLVVQTLYYTGMRISECLNLQVKDVDFHNDVVKVIKSKGKKERHIPMNPKLKSLLIQYSENDRSDSRTDHFFCTNYTGRLSRSYVNKVIAAVVSKLSWSDEINCHSLRHAFASNLVKKDVHIVHIQKLLGHTSLTTTSVYTHVHKADLKQAINSL
jgi:integrase/recombinase XerD